MVYAIALMSAAMGIFADYEIAKRMLHLDHPIIATAIGVAGSTGLIALCLFTNQASP